LPKHPEKKEKTMNVRKAGILLMVITLLSIGFAQNPFKGIGKPLPKPVPPTCDSDMLCW
jgi:hypothetical protein